MQRTHRYAGWAVLGAFVAGGVGIGAALPALKLAAADALGRSGLAVALVVNLVMPLLVVALSALYPRLRVALPGTFLATVGFVLVGGRTPPPLSWEGLSAMLGQMKPVLVVACCAYHVLAVGTVLVMRFGGRAADAGGDGDAAADAGPAQAD